MAVFLQDTGFRPLGIFGEYLWRILVQAQHRAPWIVDRLLPPDGADQGGQQPRE